MLFNPGGTHRNSSRKSLVARLRRLSWLFRNIDLDQVAEFLAELDRRQRKIEQAQSNVETILIDARSKLESLLSTQEVSMLDIKNLGYELGRALAKQNLSDRPVRVDHTRLLSKLCTQDDFATDWLAYWCSELRAAPFYHRKIWELCYVAQALFADGQLAPGRRGIGFGCGEEPLPSLFAKYGSTVLATDLAHDHPEAAVWQLTSQHAQAIETIRRPDICPQPELLAGIEFQPVNMNDIPREFDGQFDFCWSTCALEHLGTLENGLKFIENSLRTLKPGGMAAHTTEFTITDGATIDNHPIVLYQRRHFEDLGARLHAAGHQVSEFDFSPGSGVLDRFVDLPPFRDNDLIAAQHYAHLKLLFDGYTCTSAGIIIKA
jgi:SAM-dependent methyltransferase